MIAKEFPEVNVRIAEHQEEFLTLPAFWNSFEGSMTVCFELTEDELNRVKATNEIWIKVFTHGQPFHPIAMSSNKEDLLVPPPNLTIIAGGPRTGKTAVLKEIASKTVHAFLREADCATFIPIKGQYSHILIDEMIGMPAALEFIKKYQEDFKIVVATQSARVVRLLGKATVVRL